MFLHFPHLCSKSLRNRLLTSSLLGPFVRLFHSEPGFKKCYSHCYFFVLYFSEMVPSEVQAELKHLYTAAGELLRHFWSCFPVNTPFLEEKVSELLQAVYQPVLSSVFVITTHLILSCSKTGNTVKQSIQIKTMK